MDHNALRSFEIPSLDNIAAVSYLPGILLQYPMSHWSLAILMKMSVIILVKKTRKLTKELKPIAACL